MNVIGLWLAFAVILAAMAGLVIYVVFRFLVLCRRRFIPPDYGSEIVILNGHSMKSGELDLYRQAQMEQEWLFSQMLLQGQDETANPDVSDLSTDW